MASKGLSALSSRKGKGLSVLNRVFDKYKQENDVEGVLQTSNAIALNILYEEIGHYGKPDWDYEFDEKTRDILLAHARQDSGAAHLLSQEIMREVYGMKRKIRWLWTINYLLLGLVILFVLVD